MGVERELEKQIDIVWMGFLDKIIKKKRVLKVRSTQWGDDVDLLVPQIRALCLMHTNLDFPHYIYNSSYLGAKRNSRKIIEKLTIKRKLQDILWELKSSNDTRAFDLLSKVISMIFSKIMEINKEGLLSVEEVYTDPPDHIKVTSHLEECAECFGVKGAKHPLCFYHAGTLTGIMSTLLDKKLYGYETECYAVDGEVCTFIIEDNSKEHENYVNPGEIAFSLVDKRLEDTFGRKMLRRPMGNDTDLGYYQLTILSSLIENPKMFSASCYDAGIKYGRRLASFLQAYYNKKEEGLFDMISHYYQSLKQLQIEREGAEKIRAKAVAEISGLPNDKVFLGFLCGELEGLFSVMRKEKVLCKDMTFEKSDLVIPIKKQE
jgi:predicted hydrocarbon binding protein